MSIRNVGASVRQKLLNQARSQGRPFQEVLQYFAMERFLYRLSQSESATTFVLKGALLLTAWRAPFSRPTLDIDLEALTSNDLRHIENDIRKICDVPVIDDGIIFQAGSLRLSRIREDADYEGIRAQFSGSLEKARVRMQIDIGFGDVITPGAVAIAYPTILDLPAPHLRAYPRETVVAEKLEAIAALGFLNTRLKDYFDLWLLSELYSFEESLLVQAVTATFHRRATRLEGSPVGLTESFSKDPARQVQWIAFRKRTRLTSAPDKLAELVELVSRFATPFLTAAVAGESGHALWTPQKGWLNLPKE